MSPHVRDDGLSAGNDEVNDVDGAARRRSINQLVGALVHAGQCVRDDDHCDFDNCQRMKHVIGHVKACDRRSAGGCPICKQLVALCCHHARNCLKADCAVPLCLGIKWKLMREQEEATECSI